MVGNGWLKMAGNGGKAIKSRKHRFYDAFLKDREVTQTAEHTVLKQRMMRSLYVIINNDFFLFVAKIEMN